MENSIESLISKIDRAYRKEITKKLSTINLAYDDALFLIDISNEQNISQNTICKNMSFDKAIGTRVIKRLLKVDLIYLLKNEEDHRQNFLKLTEAGLKTKKIVEQILYTTNNKMVASFSKNEQQNLKKVLLKLEQNIGGA